MNFTLTVNVHLDRNASPTRADAQWERLRELAQQIQNAVDDFNISNADDHARAEIV